VQDGGQRFQYASLDQVPPVYKERVRAVIDHATRRHVRPGNP
jgi:hypothetical protein